VFFYEIKGEIEKNIIKTSWYIFFIICLIYSLINKFTGPTSLTSTINNVFLIIICFLYFRDTFKIKEKLSLAKEPVFWIATGTLFYCLATFFSMGFLKYLRENNNPLANKYFLINYVMNYTLYLTYIIGLLCSKTYQK
jgi:FtsH-binding integral membrane protein